MKRILSVVGLLGLLAPAGLAQDKPFDSAPSVLAQDKPVSYTKDIAPIFKATCEKCHNPKKAKGKLDMSTYASLAKGGKEGKPWVAGDPDKSLIIKSISGKEPEMPEEGDPLKPEQIALIARWIKEGAKDDSAK